MAATEGKINFIHNFVSGAAAGAGQIVVGYPFDTVKVKMQVGSTVAGSTIKAPTGPWDCVKSILREDGFRGLFRGMSSPLVGSLVFNSILFGCFEEFKYVLTPAGQEPTALIFASAAALTGVAESAVYTPTELVKTRMQTMYHGQQVRVADVVKDIVRTRGLSGLFMGLKPTVLREAPGNVVYFGSYEYFKGSCPATWGLHATSIFSGGMAGIAYWFTQFPMDVIKTRMQTDSLSNPRYKGVIHCAQTIVREEGLRNMFRGLTPCLLRAFPANAAAFYIFELSRTTLVDITVRLQERRSSAPITTVLREDSEPVASVSCEI